MSLNAKQQRFVDEYLKDSNATQAAIRAGYSKKTAGSIGDENLKKPDIKKEIKRRQAILTKKAGLTAEQIINEVSSLAFSNVADYMDVENNEIILKDWSKLSREQLAAVQEISVVREKYIKGHNSDDDKFLQIIKFKLHDKRPNLELLGRRFNAFPNKLQLSDPDDKPLEIVRVVINNQDAETST